MSKAKFIIMGLIALVALTAAPTLAQEQKEVPCFDYYEFQSVKVSMGANKTEFMPGEIVNFSGSIINTNLYPIVDGYLFARVVKENPAYLADGHFVVDEFFAVEKFVIDADTSKKVSFSWKVPDTLSKGNYKVLFSFTAGKRYNLAGLAFTNEVVASTADFNVSGTNDKSLLFDRSQTKINGAPYYHIADDVSYEPGSAITITQPIKNNHKEEKSVKIKYELYYWDGLDEQDKIKSTTEEVLVPANGSKVLTYKLERVESPIYYLRITAISGDDKSIVSVRVASPLERPRLNFLTVTNFPVFTGEKTELFACFHNGSDAPGKGTIVVSVSDKDGNEISKINYTGDIPSGMKAIAKEFTATKDYTYLKLSAEVYNGKNTQVEKYEVIYDCRALSSERCRESAAPTSTTEPAQLDTTIIIMAVVLLLLIIAIIILVKRRKMSGVGAIMVIVCLVGLGWLVLQISNKDILNTVMAARDVVLECRRNPSACNYFGKKAIEDCTGEAECSAAVGRTYAHFWLWSGRTMGKSLADGYVTVEHNVNITKTSAIGVGDVRNLIPSDRLHFDYVPENPFYHGFGGRFDTPYGDWRNTLAQLRPGVGWTGGTADKNFMKSNRGANAEERVATLRVRDYEDKETDYAWIFWTGIKPRPTLISSDPDVISCRAMNCTAGNKVGSAIIKMEIPETTVRIWSLVYTDQITAGGWVASLPGYDDPNITINNVPYLRPNTNIDKERAEAQKDGDGYYSNEQAPFAGKSSMELPAAEMTWTVNVSPAGVCGNGVVEVGEQCDSGAGNGACPASCSAACLFNTGCPCVTNCGGGGPGASCNVTASCQQGLCCNAGTCSANCSGNVCTANCAASGKDCCFGNQCKTNCNCAGEPISPAQQCCGDGFWREKCNGCQLDTQCAASRNECCDEVTGKCETDQKYCVAANFGINVDNENIKIYLTDNPGEHSGGTKVKIIPSGGFNSPISFSIISTDPADLYNKMTNRTTAFSPVTLLAADYSVGSVLNIKVLDTILPNTQSSKTYKMTIRAKASTGEERSRAINVTIYGPDYAEG